MVTLETERLLLRQFCVDDLDALAAIGADLEVMEFLGPPMSRRDAWRAMAMVLGHWELRGYGSWAVEERATGQLLGRIGLYNPEGWPGLEVGWTLARAAWGRGYATEGARASLDYAFDTLGADHVISVIDPDNTRSLAVAEGLGERYERMWDLDGNQVAIYGIDRP
jgi:RimJ/RimL family protein N-acetyltransferase